MKKIIYLSLLLPLFLISCTKKTDESTPEAHFFTESIEPEVGQVVVFTNDSQNAVSFEWNFGDGVVSTDENPSHIFIGTGPFEVVLTAVSKSGLTSKASLTITVMIPTLLEIEVREYYKGYTVGGASVILYPTIVDWDAQTNPTAEGLTDANGDIVFSNLGPYVYYVDVWEANHDNYTLRNEDVGFIRTPEILPHRINMFLALVDTATHAKSAERVARKVIVGKIERKAADKPQPAAGSWPQDWKELYNRRVGKK